MMNKIFHNLKAPRELAIKILGKISPLIKSDRLYLSIRYRLFMKRRLNLDNPQTFNEKLNWLKLYYHDPIYIKLVDKYEVKQIVSDLIGKDHVIPTLGIWDSVDDIDFYSLPNKFVLKCTHDSGGIIICKDKNNLDIRAAKKKLANAMRRNYFNQSREWGYKHVPARIIAEQYMEDSISHALNDFKFFCFNGEVKLLYVASDRSSGVKFDFYDLDFNHLDITNAHPNSDTLLKKPVTFEKMKTIATKLSKDYPFMRIDLYEVDGRVYFGEYTLYHNGGTLPFEPEEFDYKMGEWIILPEKNV